MKAMPLRVCPMNDCERYKSNKKSGTCIHAVFDDEVTMCYVPGPKCPWPKVPDEPYKNSNSYPDDWPPECCELADFVAKLREGK
jgi:hypothetical protein